MGAVSQIATNGFDQQKLWLDILTRVFESPKNAYAIGNACLRTLPPKENSAEQLANAILVAAEIDSQAAKTTQAIRDRISNRVRKEFVEDAVVSVDGWILSVTEARLYALVALSVESEP
jgi:hypothetical protein